MPTLYHESDCPIPGHTLLKFLGEGGFGEVWKAQNPYRIEVALKIVQIQGKQGLREVLAIRLLRNIRHPNLIPIFGFWLKDQEGNILENAVEESMSGFLLDGEYQFFLAMGLGEKNLGERLQECRKEGLPGIPQDELMQYMEESARALDFLNASNHVLSGKDKSSIEHCDIKPQNLMLVGGSVQICDFGLTRVLQHGVKQQHSASFSHHYVAPELLRRELGPTRGTDQYSLAISYVQLRSGRLPFGDVSFAPAILTAHLEGRLDFSFLPPREQQVLRKATALQAADRFATVKSFVDALREALGAATRTSKLNEPGLKGPLRPGLEIIPGYRLEELIGRGSFGEVWRASGPGRLKKALKIIRNLDLASGRQEMRSLELITEVRHPHLLTIEAYYLLDAQGDLIPDERRDGEKVPKADTLIIVSELAESHLGSRLQQCQRQTGAGIAPQELLSYVQHVAGALDCLNTKHDIIHRDVKPENILLVGGVAKLADFGLAKALEGSSALVHTKSIGMTPAYAAPELCNSRIEASTDQYSLALTYYHLRTGHLGTGDASDLSELILAHLHNKLSFEGVPPAEERVLRKATTLDSRQRYPNCTAFARALAATFSRSQLPDDWQQESQQDVLEKNWSHPVVGNQPDPHLSLQFLPDTNLEHRALALQTDENPSVETITKLTDTARVAGQKPQNISKAETEALSPLTTHRKRARKRSRGKRVAQAFVLLLGLGLCGGVGTLIYLKQTNPRESSIGTSSTSITVPSATKEIDKPVIDTPVAKSPVKSPVESPVESKTPDPVVPPRRDPFQEGKDFMAQRDFRGAVKPLCEFAAGPAPRTQQQDALALAVRCYHELGPVDAQSKLSLRRAFEALANASILELQKPLLQDGPVPWKQALEESRLADPDQIWVNVLWIEAFNHDSNSVTKEELQQALACLEKHQDFQPHHYRGYLLASAYAGLQEKSKAAAAMATLPPNQPEWTSPRRRAKILSLLAEDYQAKKRQLRLDWAHLDGAKPEFGQAQKSLAVLRKWQETDQLEDRLLWFLSTAAEAKTPSEFAQACAAAKSIPIAELTKAPDPWHLAFLNRYGELLRQSKNQSTAELVQVAFAFISKLRQLDPAVLSAANRFPYLQEWVQYLLPLTPAAGSESPEVRQHLAQLLSWHGEWVFVQTLADALDSTNSTAAARQDFATAAALVDADADRIKLRLWEALSGLELQDPQWHRSLKLSEIQAATLAPDLQPVLFYLQGIRQLEEGRAAKSQKQRLTAVKNGMTQLELAAREWQNISPAPWRLLQLARIGQSNAHLEYANYLHVAEPAPNLKEERDHLRAAEEAARLVLNDAQAVPLHPRAQIALGNALEDFHLLLGENRNRDAKNAFADAERAWHDKPASAPALLSLARLTWRMQDKAQFTTAARQLQQAITFQKERHLEEGDLDAEAYFWLAKIAVSRNELDQGDAYYEHAERLAKTPYFRDDAHCERLEILLIRKTENLTSGALLSRIDQIDRWLPKPEFVDPQIRRKAVLLRLRGLQEQGDLRALLAVLDEKQRNAQINQLSAIEKRLRNESNDIAYFYACRLQCLALRISLRESDPDQANRDRIAQALQISNLDGKWTAYLERIKDQRKTNPLYESALLELANLRFELQEDYFNYTKGTVVRNLQLVDEILPYVEKESAYFPIMIGHVGLLRSSALRPEIQLPADRERTQLRKEAIEHLEQSLRLAPDFKRAWYWNVALFSLLQESDPAKAKACLSKAVTLAMQRPDWEIDQKTKNALKDLLQKFP
jgi:serine/threonine protein kinase